MVDGSDSNQGVLPTIPTHNQQPHLSSNMISLTVALCLVAFAAAAPQINPYYPGAYPRAVVPGGFIPIISQHYDLNPDQSYNFAYASADGSSREEVGAPRVPGPEGPAVAVQGQYTYASPAGPIQVAYVADENGYQPSGPGVHPAIVKAVAEQVAEARGGPVNAAYYNPLARPY